MNGLVLSHMLYTVDGQLDRRCTGPTVLDRQYWTDSTGPTTRPMYWTGQLNRWSTGPTCTGPTCTEPANSTDRPTRPKCRFSTSSVQYSSVQLAGPVHRRSSACRSSWPVEYIGSVELAGRVHRSSTFRSSSWKSLQKACHALDLNPKP